MSAAVRTRKEARAIGATRYFTGLPCPAGHIAERSTVNATCVKCIYIKRKARYYSDTKKAISQSIKWGQANPEKRKATVSRWQKNNPVKNREKVMRYHARKLKQLCKCCTREQIESIYAACPPGSEVDHKRPIALGGLHCRHNLQILTEMAHRIKTTEDLRDIRALKSVLKGMYGN
jgi:hypothetical protein